MKKSLILALAVSAGLLAGSLYAKDESKKHYRTEFKSSEQCSAKHLIGARVNDAQGQKIGQIEDLLVDPNSARAPFAVVRLSGDLAQGKAYTPIPLTALRPETMRASATDQPKVYVLTVDRSKLLSASRFNVERWPAEQTAYVSWGPEVYSHYGMSWDAAGAPSGEVYVERGDADRGLEPKDTIEPPTDFREKSVDNGTAPDGKTTFPFLHEQTDQD